MTYLSTFLENFLNKSKTWIPQECLLCGTRTKHFGLCETCLLALPYYTTSQCSVCGIPTEKSQICMQCQQNPPNFQRTIIGFHYDYPFDKLIQRFKYQMDLTIGYHLGVLFAEQIAHSNLLQTDIILPMPAHPQRLKTRGFNQAVELAKILGKKLNLPVQTDCCHRIFDTQRQATLSREERSTNLIDAFVCEDRLRHCRVALVDDVMTTGATFDAFAQAVTAAGAARVERWALARTNHAEM